jgi:hypothetical protein
MINDTAFKNFSCYQEVNVRDLCPGYPHHNHHFDWYIEQLGLVVELHGAQHYKPTSYGALGVEDTLIGFRRAQYRDATKLAAALEAGLTYIAIPYTDEKKISYELIVGYMLAAQKEDECSNQLLF